MRITAPYLLAGHYISLPDLIHTLADLTGRRLRLVVMPRWFLAGFGRAADTAQRRLKTRVPWQGEGIWVMNCAAHCDDHQARTELTIEPRPLHQTITDTIHWLLETGHITPAQADRLADAPA